MKLPKNYFQNISIAKYRESLKLLPPIEKEHTYLFIMLSLTFGALSFFGIFAINPTISTIVSLQKELEENRQVAQELQTKIENLSNLHQQYMQIEPDLAYVYEALPKAPRAPVLSAKIAGLLRNNNLTMTSYHVAQVQLIKVPPQTTKNASFIFTLQAEGDYEQMMKFSNDVAKMDRIVTIESMSIGRDVRTNNLQLSIRGRQYFMP